MYKLKRARRAAATVLCLLTIQMNTVEAQNSSNVMIVFDASGSMWGQIEDETKIGIAREAFANVQSDWDHNEQNVGLIAYGHRRKGDCNDIETLVPLDSGTGAQIIEKLEQLRPKGKTPLSDAVRIAAEKMRFAEEPATVVLISDGVETCVADPCATARTLEESGVDFTAHVIGIDITDAEADAQLRCIAEETGGQYLSAANTLELSKALSTAFVPPTEPVEPVVPQLPNTTLNAPDTANISALIAVSWDGLDVSGGGYELIVRRPGGAKINGTVVRKNAPAELELPAESGTYEIAIQQISGQTILAKRMVEVADVPVTLLAPDPAFAGSTLAVEWTGPGYRTDRIGIGLQGQRPNSHTMLGDHASSPTDVFVPVEPGSYVITYYLSQDQEVLASRPVEVVLPSATVIAPPQAVAGSVIKVEVDGPMFRNDLIGLVPAGSGDRAKGRFTHRLNQSGPVRLQMPDEPGAYEIHYFLANKNVRIGSANIAVVPETKK